MNIRPHPGPLPQERENCSPSACISNAFDNLTRFGTNHLGLETASGTYELSSNIASPSLSTGERAGVRAGVNTIHHFVGMSCLPL